MTAFLVRGPRSHLGQLLTFWYSMNRSVRGTTLQTFNVYLFAGKMLEKGEHLGCAWRETKLPSAEDSLPACRTLLTSTKLTMTIKS